MARIRTIKPAFFESESMSALTPRARLLFVALWTIADKAGRLRWLPRKVVAHAFPHEDVDGGPLLDELIRSGSVVVYEVDGRSYAEIPGWKLHQRCPSSERPSVLPSIDDASLTSSRRQADDEPPAPRRNADDESTDEGRPKAPPAKAKAPRKAEASVDDVKVSSSRPRLSARELGIGNRELGEEEIARGREARRWDQHSLRAKLGDTAHSPKALQAPKWLAILEANTDEQIDAAIAECTDATYPISMFLRMFDDKGRRNEDARPKTKRPPKLRRPLGHVRPPDYYSNG